MDEFRWSQIKVGFTTRFVGAGFIKCANLSEVPSTNSGQAEKPAPNARRKRNPVLEVAQGFSQIICPIILWHGQVYQVFDGPA
jgi:hypothetical protein